MTDVFASSAGKRQSSAELSVGIVLLPNFTMMALAGFVDSLRLAADEGDLSRQIRCKWHIMAEGKNQVKASNGIVIQPWAGFTDPEKFDYLLVVGGTLHNSERESDALLGYLRKAAERGTPLIGLCNGVFALARAGLMKGRRACLSWFHHEDYQMEFPDHEVVSDRMFLVDGSRITCPGGVGAIHLASWLIERNLGKGAASKGLRIMLEDSARPGETPQPTPLFEVFSGVSDRRVRRALLAMDRQLDKNLTLSGLANMVGSTPRNLSRLFLAELGVTPKRTLETMRIAKAKRLFDEGCWSVADIAAQCGFSDASHLTRRFRTVEGVTPGEYKRRKSKLRPRQV